MSSTDRQNRLLLTEDWKKVYQSFRNADFKSYDFDNLRRTMIQYLRENYPEDFNDYVESSEYLALVDLIAFLGQNISFRIDLNARENYLELAERRESVLRLARLLSYNPKRNQSSEGMLKLDSIRTSEDITDSNGTSLQGQTILWNDSTNENWYEQFIKILNTALPVNGTFGRPIKKSVVQNVSTEKYRFNSISTDVPVFGFDKIIDGQSLSYEIVSADIENNDVIEETPLPGNKFSILYRDDGKGISSTNSGFFAMFKQGTLDQGVFTIENPSTNQSVAIETPNINNNDLWLYKLDSNGNEEELWTKVEALEGNNVIYNNLSKDIRNIYSVLTRVDDRVSLIFSDGVFGNLPKGQFRVFYRVGANSKVRITPADFRRINITLPYISKTGKAETIELSFSLKSIVDNASVSETTESIKNNAPATYYTQNRMVTGEDYQVAPLSINQEIIKVKSVNRTSSGISRYFDLIDATGKYSTTNLYGNDGVVYKEFNDLKQTFSFATKTDIEGVVENTITPILNDTKVRNFYLDRVPRILTEDLGITWTQTTKETNLSSGSFLSGGVPVFLGRFTASILSILKPGTLIKFTAPSGQHFMPDGTLMQGGATHFGASSYKWCKVTSVEGKGTELRENGLGAVVLNDIIPTGAVLAEIKPSLANSLTESVKQEVIDQIFAQKVFGLRFDQNDTEWKLVTQNNLNFADEFSTGKTGDTTNQQLDASWLLLFQTNTETYTITFRSMRYIFESENEIRFYYDENSKIFDNTAGKVIKDKVSVLNINPKPDTPEAFTQDFDWEITDAYRDAEGYIDSKKVEVSYFDSDEDGVVDDVDIFEQIVAPLTNSSQKWIIFKKVVSNDGVEDYNYFPNNNKEVIILSTKADVRPFSEYNDGQIFYYIDTDIFEVLDQASLRLNISSDYKARQGRDKLKFHYIHAVNSDVRIDPSASNIIDMYLLTRTYDTNFRLWMNGQLSTKPLPPSSDALSIAYNPSLMKIKSLTDEIIYHPVKYKILFGNKAEEDLRAVFKIVKNTDKVLNDNEIKSKVVDAINQFFALDNWDFGDKFYFSELANYVMYELSPDINTFIIVPTQVSQVFGSLYEIKSETNEIFISGATVDNIEIIDSVTASKLRAAGEVVTQSITSSNVGVQSSSLNDTATNVTTSTSSTTSSTTSSSGTTSSSSGSSGSNSNSGGYSY